MRLSDIAADQRLRVMLYGDSGVGKTCLATGFPLPMEVADFDGKIESAANFWMSRDRERLNQIEVVQYRNDPAKPHEGAYARFYRRLLEWEKMAGEAGGAGEACPLPRTVVVDSLTLLIERMLEDIVRKTNAKRFDPKIPVLQDYLKLGNELGNVLYRLLSLPCNLVMTAHIQLTKDENTGAINYEPMAPGKIAKSLPIRFPEVWRAFVKGKGTDVQYCLQTQADSRYVARTQIGLASEMRADFREVEKVFAGKGDGPQS